MSWRLLRLRGIVALGFGLVVFHWPGLTMLALAFLWASYSLVDGISILWSALAGRDKELRSWLSLTGLAGIACGFVTFAMPDAVADRLPYVIAAWAAVTGAMQVWTAVRLRKAVDREWILALDGAVVILFGVVLVVWPNLEVAALIWLVGWFVIALGTLYLGMAYWLTGSRATF